MASFEVTTIKDAAPRSNIFPTTGNRDITCKNFEVTPGDAIISNINIDVA